MTKLTREEITMLRPSENIPDDFIPVCKASVQRKLCDMALLSLDCDGVVVPSDSAINQAVARGWCHRKNAHKQMDGELALAIADEIKAMLAACSQPPREGGKEP